MGELRKAEAGDICVLLLPEGDELMGLRREQEALVKAYGGWVVPEPHITLQRFRIQSGPDTLQEVEGADRFQPVTLNTIIEATQAALQQVQPFAVQAAGLTQFLAPFWGTYVLRWKVQRNEGLNHLIEVLDSSLQASGCELHYSHDIVLTCSAVDLTRQIRLDTGPADVFPRPLFSARRVLFSGVLGANDFVTLGMARIGI